MKLKMLLMALLAFCIGVGTNAQTKEKVEKETQKKIIIHKKSIGTEKLTVIVDGDKVTVNGKPVEDRKDLDIEIINEKNPDLLSQRGNKQLAPMANFRMMGDEFTPNTNRAFLGVITEKTDGGAKINTIEKESAAEKAGLKKADVITKIGSEKIESSQDLFDVIAKYKPADPVVVTYLRDGKESTATVILGKKTATYVKVFQFNNPSKNDHFNVEIPEIPGLDGMEFNFAPKPRLGLQIQDAEDGKGVKIMDVDNDTPAKKAGLQAKDLITDINGIPINSVDEIKAMLQKTKAGDSYKLSYQRAGKIQITEIKFPKKIKTAHL